VSVVDIRSYYVNFDKLSGSSILMHGTGTKSYLTGICCIVFKKLVYCVSYKFLIGARRNIEKVDFDDRCEFTPKNHSQIEC